jgi:class 3 adenylate cyclase/tetratricopeptide (TPR) repeat protein
VICTACGRSLGETDNFCPGCGQRIRRDAARQRDDAEQRVLTVFFCDLVGSTELGQQIDPEQLRALVTDYYDICDDAITRFGGHVVKHTGDGALAYFGYPVASDDDAASAVLAGLEICQRTSELTTTTDDDANLSVRVGINTGPAIVGETGSGTTREALSVGDTINIASRIEGRSPPGKVTISDATRRLLGDTLEVEALGPQQLKGVTDPIELFVVTGSLRPARRVDHRGLVGRRSELDRILQLSDEVRAGSERYLAIIGEPGIGKSTLTQAACDAVGMRSVWVSCSRFLRNSNLHPISLLVEQLGRGAHERQQRPLDDAAAHVFSAALDRTAAADARLGVDEAELADFTPRARRQYLFRHAARTIREAARSGPLLVVIDDLQWADPSTIEFLSWMSDGESSAALLFLLPTRPTLHDLPAAVERLHLRPLADDDIAGIVQQLGVADPELASRIVRRADGVPLFAEELVKSSSTDAGDNMPLTLQASLTAQLDRLGSARNLAQLGSLLGSGFGRDLLRGLSEDPPGFDDHVEQLLELEIFQSDEDGHLAFRHALVQEAAASSMVGSVSRREHRRIATYYEESEQSSTILPESIGQHWSSGGDDERAVPYYLLAASRAVADYAQFEAVSFYDAAIAGLERIAATAPQPGDVGGDARLLDAYERRGDIFALLHRNDAAVSSYTAALGRTHDPVQRGRLHTRIGLVHQQDLELSLAALDAADEALTRAERTDDSWHRARISALLARMRTHYWFGGTDSMQSISDELTPLVDRHGTPQQRAEYFNQCILRNLRRERYTMSDETVGLGRSYVAAATETNDVGEMAEAHFTLGFILLFGGRVRASTGELEQSLRLARRSGNRTIEVRALTYHVTAMRMLADPRGLTVTNHERARRLAEDEAMVEYAAVADANLAWIAYQRGDHDTAAARARRALDLWTSTGMAWPFRWLAALPLLAAACEQGDAGGIVAAATALTSGTEQLLPDELMRTTREIVGAPSDQHDEELVLASGRRLLDQARLAGLAEIARPGELAEES